MIPLRNTRYLRNSTRMCWANKLLEWNKTPEYAFRTVLR